MKLSAEQFNQQYPLGTSVKYFPVKGHPEFKETTTRSEAWALGHGDVVVNVQGISGCVLIEHLELLTKSDEPALQITRQEPELTLSALLTQRCIAFANSEKAVEIVDKGVESLFKNIVEDAFSSYGEFGKTAKAAFKAALPGNVDEIIDLEKYNSMVVRLMQERWAASGVESDLVEKMTDMVNEFVNEEKTPKIILASDLWAAFIEENKESALENSWESPQVVMEDDDRGYVRVGLHAEESTSSRYSSNKTDTYNCDVCLALSQQFERDGGSKTPIQHDGHDVYELYAGHFKHGSVLGKKIITAYTRFDKLVLALYYGGSLLAWDESPDDLYYPGYD